MTYTEDEIIDALMSDKLDQMVKAGEVYAVVLKDGTVSLQMNGKVLTNYIKVEQK
jgi:hypothetical protein